ncbi:hypothetical protein [Streptomyces sp. NBC_00385]|uniref:hypothetical protein n=1 Tax=Streptomyces sp. NBC_00385 TaxID=2975733 RepID=UPI002DD98C09|nr:hypothetical protein [Streptomyces sp. NBC_00385]WRZ08203.1 hypothetical protein OG959_35090 [Streptomyces sp. NBC_00385]
MSRRVPVSPLLGVVLALSLAGCGSTADKDQDVPGPTSAGSAPKGRAADGSASGDCPDKHAVTVQDDKFGGTADIDLCARPEVHRTAVRAAWVSVYSHPTVSPPLNIMPVSCTGESEESCKVVKVGDRDLCNQAKPDCHPRRGEEVPVLCSSVDQLNSDRLYYGVLLDSKRLLAMGTDHDRSYTKVFTDKGDIAVGYVDAQDLEKVQGELPACDGTLLHGSGARTLGQIQGLPLD